MLVLGGENDASWIPKDVHETARAYAVEADIIPNMAHDAMLEAGWRDAADRILNWLRALDL